MPGYGTTMKFPRLIIAGTHSGAGKTTVTGRPSRNLDGWMLSQTANLETFIRAAADADLSIIEGMMGLFDGSSSVSEVGSTADLAKQQNAPVLPVVDAGAMARSARALASGYARFDSKLREERR